MVMKMGKYISVEKQLVRLYRLGLDNEEVIKQFLLTACVEDVEKVRHGKWIRTHNPIGQEITLCSVCGNIKQQAYPNYCGNCGAKMDEVENEVD